MFADSRLSKNSTWPSSVFSARLGSVGEHRAAAAAAAAPATASAPARRRGASRVPALPGRRLLLLAAGEGQGNEQRSAELHARRLASAASTSGLQVLEAREQRLALGLCLEHTSSTRIWRDESLFALHFSMQSSASFATTRRRSPVVESCGDLAGGELRPCCRRPRTRVTRWADASHAASRRCSIGERVSLGPRGSALEFRGAGARLAAARGERDARGSSSHIIYASVRALVVERESGSPSRAPRPVGRLREARHGLAPDPSRSRPSPSCVLSATASSTRFGSFASASAR